MPVRRGTAVAKRPLQGDQVGSELVGELSVLRFRGAGGGVRWRGGGAGGPLVIDRAREQEGGTERGEHANSCCTHQSHQPYVSPADVHDRARVGVRTGV
jgi:hypothetical protein